MSTLISVHTSEGCIGRCDAKCYDAKEPDCDCICGGRNHGGGKEKAIEQTREMAEEWLDEYASRKGLKKWRGKINRNLVDQFSLFDCANLSAAIPTSAQKNRPQKRKRRATNGL